MNQSKIPFAYKTASWVAVGLVVSACSSAPPPESVLIPLQNEYKTLVANPDARFAEVALYETEKVLKQAEALEPATLKGSSKSKLAAQQELEHLQYIVDKKLKLANETIQTKQIEQQYNSLLKQREDTVSVAHLNAMSAVKAQASASQKEVAQMAAQLQDMQLKRAQLQGNRAMKIVFGR